MTNSPVNPPLTTAPIYQGQFGEFTITDRDRREVILYRAGLVVAAVAFAIATVLALALPTHPLTPTLVTGLYALFSLGLGLSLWLIHIYLIPLHRTLQVFWAIGSISAIALAWYSPEPLAAYVYHVPLTLFGVGFSFAALTGIFFKEAFCFNRAETKLLTPLVPLLLLGHLTGLMAIAPEQILLAVWAALFLVFAARKCLQPIPDDIGDKSVFAYLKGKAKAKRIGQANGETAPLV